MLHETYEEESQKPYFQSIKELFDKYEDGWNVFIKAHEEQDWSMPVPRKPEYENDPYIPHTWLGLADRVISIIAKEKYKLDPYPNRIEIVRADQMLDAYTNPVPGGPSHWSYGKRRMQEQQKFDKQKHLAFEIIINSSPALALCMDTNSPVMQMLVIAHASYGHSAFYKNNFLFKDLTNADSVLHVNARLRDLVDECEEKYGIEEVEAVLDMCHAMRFMDTSDKVAKEPMGRKEKECKEKEAAEKRWLHSPKKRVFKTAAEGDVAGGTSNDNQKNVHLHPSSGARNILEFIADEVDHLPEWKREIMRLSSVVSQNFAANAKTNMINEGIACITHYQVMEDLFTLGLMNAEMHGEFRDSHAKVTYQPPGWKMTKNRFTGEDEEKFIGSDINIYALGFAMMQDIKRICFEPTEEDLEWFPQFAGSGEWIEMMHSFMEACTNETAVEQFLSPTVMRKFKYFLLEGAPKDKYLEISAIHNADGFKKLRAQLAADYRIADKIPKVSLKDYQQETDRCLVLQHHVIHDQELDESSLNQILELIHTQTKQPVVMESVDENGKVLNVSSSPPDYNHAQYARIEPHYKMDGPA